jgi:hypothetical protein
MQPNVVSVGQKSHSWGTSLVTGGVMPDPKRIEAILNYPRLKNVKQLKEFLGVCNYHHRFIVNFSRVRGAITSIAQAGL